MKKIIVFILSVIMTVLMCVCLSGCDEENNTSFSNSNFDVVSTERHLGAGYVIIYHKETKVMYLYIENHGCAGLTVMLDKNGKPLLYQGD